MTPNGGTGTDALNTRTDVRVAQASLDALARSPIVPTNVVRVSVSDRWVTLIGEVPWQFQRAAAERAVRRIRGVVGVTNNITTASPVKIGDVVVGTFRNAGV